MTSKFEDLFPDLGLGCELASSLGYCSTSLSLFDHWLTEEEADHCQIMNYSTAKKAGKLREYMEGEDRFLQFYSSASLNGVICNHPGPVRKLDRDATELTNIIVDSLREKRLMDIYLVGYQARVEGGYDRTDLILVREVSFLSRIEEKAASAGLFILTHKKEQQGTDHGFPR